MDWILTGIILTTIGALLGIWSIIFARIQAKKISNIYHNELISLWARLGRIHMLITQIQKVIDSKEFIENSNISIGGSHVLPQIFKGLCSEYVALTEAIVKKTANISLKLIIEWFEINKIKTIWELEQFIRIIPVNEENNEQQIKDYLKSLDILPDYGLSLGGTIKPTNVK